MKLKKIAALFMAMVMVVGATACGGNSDAQSASGDGEATESTEESGGDGELNIAYIVKAKTDEFWTSMEKGAEAYAKEAGVNLEFQAPEKETDIEKQVQMVENAVIKGVDGIVLSVADSQALIPSIIKANEADIPVVLVNDTIDEEALEADGGHVETYVGINQYDAAKLAGDYAVENITDGKICYLEGISGVKAHEDRLLGFADSVDFDVLASQTAKCDRNEAFNVMQNVLSATPDVNVVWAINAEMGQGAIQAIEQGGFEGKVQVFDFDASSDDLAAIEAGTLVGTVAQYPEIQASTAIQCCIDAINGEELEPHTETKAQLITKDNLEEYRAEIAELTE